MTQEARLKALSKYNPIRYTQDRRPKSNYPKKLISYLNKSFLKRYKHGSILDLGCGRGDFFEEFKDLNFDTHGIDISVSESFYSNHNIIIQDIDGHLLPYPDNSFDIIFNKSVIEHIKNTDIFISECFRILKPNGICITLTPDWKAQYKHFYDDYTHVKPFTLMGLQDAFLGHDFTLIKSQRFRQLPFVWKFSFLHFLCDIIALLPNFLKLFKLVKFSKEWMLLLITMKKEISS